MQDRIVLDDISKGVFWITENGDAVSYTVSKIRPVDIYEAYNLYRDDYKGFFGYLDEINESVEFDKLTPEYSEIKNMLSNGKEGADYYECSGEIVEMLFNISRDYLNSLRN